MQPYRSPYEAYPFLCDAGDDLRCDFELLTDDLASRIGLLRAKTADEAIRAELLRITELVYHINPTLRTMLTVTQAETDWLRRASERLEEAYGARASRFVLTQGSEAACLSHLLRVEGKVLVRLLYRHAEQGHEVPERLFDFANLLSSYFFYLALKLNAVAGVDEIPFESRNYPNAR